MHGVQDPFTPAIRSSHRHVPPTPGANVMRGECYDRRPWMRSSEWM